MTTIPMDARRKDLRLRDAGIKQPQCNATVKATGKQCAKHAVTGSVVCASHGGSAPQVKSAGLRRTAEMIDERIALAWKIVDVSMAKALEEGDASLAWKMIAAKASLEARAEEALAPKNIGESVILDEKGRAVDPAWAKYAIEAGSQS